MMINLSADKIKAIILGHAVGDALGVPVEFASREELDNDPITGMEGFGTYPYPAGSWSDDTSMTLCALDSLAKGTVDLDDIMVNFGKWYYKDEFTPTGEMFDVGNTCSYAIDNYFAKHMDVQHCGLTGERSNGNGSLMRIIPFVLYTVATYGTRKFNRLWEAAAVGSSLTHNHVRSRIACEIYATVLSFLIEKPTKSAVCVGINQHRKWNEFGCAEYDYFKRVDSNILKSLSRNEIKSSGYVIDTLEAALWCLLTTDSYKECVLTAVNLGDDTDTVAAVAGGLAGALYGLEAIPKEWLDKLQKRDYIESLCDKAAKVWERKEAIKICDTHMHVVPCFDDGSESIEMSLEMLSQAYRQGVRRVFCTSHSWYDNAEKTKYELAFAELKKEAKKFFPKIELLTGCEVYCEYDDIDEIVELLDAGTLPTMNGTKYVLTEFYPDVGREEAIMIVSTLLLHGYIPIIAHAERYWELRAADISAMIEMGCKIQINLFSLSEESDERTKLNAEMYCRSRLVSFVGSDAHRTNHRPPRMDSGAKRLSEICDEEYVRQICFENSTMLVPSRDEDN